MGIKKLTEGEMMDYIKLAVYGLGESAGINTDELIEKTIDKMVKLKIRPKKGGYAVQATVSFDVSHEELASVRQEIQKLIDENN